MDVSSPANALNAGEYNLYIVNPQGISAPFQIDIPTLQTQAQSSAQSPVPCPSGEQLETGAGYSECAFVQGQQSITPTVSVACQQAEQEYQTAENQFNTFEQQESPLIDNPNYAALTDSGSGARAGEMLSSESQEYANAETYALEEEQIACQ